MAMVVGRTDDRRGLRILRRRGEEGPIELGELHPLQEGKPVNGELLSLKPRQELPFLFDVKTELPDPHAAARASAEAPRPAADGPPQIATDEYRRGWEAIWGKATGARTERPN